MVEVEGSGLQEVLHDLRNAINVMSSSGRCLSGPLEEAQRTSFGASLERGAREANALLTQLEQLLGLKRG